MNQSKIISASRRTDIPGFYIDWFMKQLDLGFFKVKNPYNKIEKTIDVSPDTVHSIVFWSKDYGPFLDSKAGEELEGRGFNLYFNFTVNSESSLLEPNIVPLKERLIQMERLCSSFGNSKIAWRFDPICSYRTDEGVLRDNFSDFSVIADFVSEIGISKCVTSFLDDYKKIHRRINYLKQKNIKTPFFVSLDTDGKKKIVTRMEKYLRPKGIKLCLCCENKVFLSLDQDTTITENSCIDSRTLKEIYGGNPDIKRDYGQRSKQGCKCTKSVDIGSYDDHPCFHDCLFCYACPDIDNKIEQGKFF